jgi:hypothetical protein
MTTKTQEFVKGSINVYAREVYADKYALDFKMVQRDGLILDGVYLGIYKDDRLGYVPTHTISGLMVAGRGFKKLKDAKSFVLAAGNIGTDWHDVTSANCHTYILPDGTPLKEVMGDIRSRFAIDAYIY